MNHAPTNTSQQICKPLKIGPRLNCRIWYKDKTILNFCHRFKFSVLRIGKIISSIDGKTYAGFFGWGWKSAKEKARKNFWHKVHTFKCPQSMGVY